MQTCNQAAKRPLRGLPPPCRPKPAMETHNPAHAGTTRLLTRRDGNRDSTVYRSNDEGGYQSNPHASKPASPMLQDSSYNAALWQRHAEGARRGRLPTAGEQRCTRGQQGHPVRSSRGPVSEEAQSPKDSRTQNHKPTGPHEVLRHSYHTRIQATTSALAGMATSLGIPPVRVPETGYHHASAGRCECAAHTRHRAVGVEPVTTPGEDRAGVARARAGARPRRYGTTTDQVRVRQHRGERVRQGAEHKTITAGDMHTDTDTQDTETDTAQTAQDSTRQRERKGTDTSVQNSSTCRTRTYTPEHGRARLPSKHPRRTSALGLG